MCIPCYSAPSPVTEYMPFLVPQTLFCYTPSPVIGDTLGIRLSHYFTSCHVIQYAPFPLTRTLSQTSLSCYYDIPLLLLYITNTGFIDTHNSAKKEINILFIDIFSKLYMFEDVRLHCTPKIIKRQSKSMRGHGMRYKTDKSPLLKSNMAWVPSLICTNQYF